MDWNTITLGDVKKKHKQQYANRVREKARDKHYIKECQRCKYNLHIEICHIRAISDYPDNTLVKDINDQSNIIILCPNCHWELDEGYLVYENNQFKKSKPKKVYPKCKTCKEDFKRRNRYHVYCSIICVPKKLKCKRIPNKEELEKLIKTKPWTHIGEEFGVSDNAMRAWARKYGILKNKQRKPRVAKARPARSG
jgi:hypothetical protein